MASDVHVPGDVPPDDAPVSPNCFISCLHRHALESVFAFCALSELATVSAVSHEWQAAVLSMAPLLSRTVVQGAVSADKVAFICSSSLRRHVSSFHCTGNLGTSQSCLLLSARMPHLRDLSLCMPLDLVAPQFPPQLTELKLILKPGYDVSATVASFNAAITAISHLSQLEKLQLERHWHGGFLLAPLVRLPLLREFRLVLAPAFAPFLTPVQVDELRSLVQLERLTAPLSSALFAQLLAPPHALQYHDLGFNMSGIEVTEAVALLLPNLPLQKLQAMLAVQHADFLAQLPQLTDLEVRLAGIVQPDSTRILQGVGGCTQLRKLFLADGSGPNDFYFTSAQLSDCLVRLPQLKCLWLSGASALTSLSFLAVGSLPHSLTELHCSSFRRRLPLSELTHVLPLRELRVLGLCDVFDAPLGESNELLLQPERMPPHFGTAAARHEVVT